jgi:hypothetical protein
MWRRFSFETWTGHPFGFLGANGDDVSRPGSATVGTHLSRCKIWEIGLLVFVTTTTERKIIVFRILHDPYEGSRNNVLVQYKVRSNKIRWPMVRAKAATHHQRACGRTEDRHAPFFLVNQTLMPFFLTQWNRSLFLPFKRIWCWRFHITRLVGFVRKVCLLQLSNSFFCFLYLFNYSTFTQHLILFLNICRNLC